MFGRKSALVFPFVFVIGLYVAINAAAWHDSSKGFFIVPFLLTSGAVFGGLFGGTPFLDATLGAAGRIPGMWDPVKGTPLAAFVRRLMAGSFRKTAGRRLDAQGCKELRVRLASGGGLRVWIDGGDFAVEIQSDDGGGAKRVARFDIPRDRSWDRHLINLGMPAYQTHEPKIAALCAEACAALDAFLKGKSTQPTMRAPSKPTSAAAALAAPAASSVPAHVAVHARAASLANDSDPETAEACALIAKAMIDVGTLADVESLRNSMAPVLDHVVPNLRVVLDNYASLAVLERRDLVADALASAKGAIVSTQKTLDAHLRMVLAPVGLHTEETARILETVSRAVDLPGVRA